MATVASINVALNANTAGYNSALATAGNNTAAFAAKAKSGGGTVGQSFQAAAYAFQDFTSVLEGGGKNALGRAFGAISNNIGMITAGFGPWGMLAGTVGGVIAQLVIPRLFQSKDAVDENTTAVERLAKAHEDAARRATAAWDGQIDRMKERVEFQANLFNPVNTTDQVGDMLEQKKRDLETSQKELEIRIKQGNDLLNTLNSENKTGLTSGIFQRGGIEAIDPKTMGVNGSKLEDPGIGYDTTVGFATGGPVGAALAWLASNPELKSVGTFTPIDDDTKTRLTAAQDEIKRIKEIIALNEQQIAQAKEQKSIIMAGDAAVAAEAQNKMVEEQVAHHKNLVKSLEQAKAASDNEKLAGDVLSLAKAGSSSTRPGIASAEYGSSSAYSAIVAETRKNTKTELQELIRIAKETQAKEARLLGDIKSAVKESKPPVAGL